MLRKPMAMNIGGAIWLVVGVLSLLLRLFPLTTSHELSGPRMGASQQ